MPLIASGFSLPIRHKPFAKARAIVLTITATYILVLLLFHACTPAEVSNSPEDVFECYWQEMDKRYVYFDEKGVAWDSLYAVYRPQVSAQTTDKELFDIISQMIEPFRDAHLFLQADDIGMYYCYHLPYTINTLDCDRVLYYTAPNGNIVAATNYDILQFANSVTYIRLYSFEGWEIESDIFWQFLSDYDHSLGIIIDVTGNRGGNPMSVANICSVLFCEDYLLGYVRGKAGAEHNNFSDYIPLTLNSQCLVSPDIPLVVICSEQTYSSGNTFAAAIRQRPNTFLIGSKTGGGGATRSDFVLPNGWRFSVSEIASYDSNFYSLEHGIEPNYYVELSPDDHEILNPCEKAPHKQIDFALKLLSENAPSK